MYSPTCLVLVDYRESWLLSIGYPAQIKLHCQRVLAGVLQKTVAECVEHTDGAADDREHLVLEIQFVSIRVHWWFQTAISDARG